MDVACLVTLYGIPFSSLHTCTTFNMDLAVYDERWVP